MKDNVEIYTMALIRVIHDSDAYKDYKAVRKRLAEDPELKNRVNQYRKECYHLQNSGDVDSLYERTQRFDEQYDDLLKNPLVEEYLKCELALCRMLQQIASKVVESVELDLDDIANDIYQM